MRKAVNHRGVFKRPWAKVEDAGKVETYPAAADEPVPVVELKANRVTYRGHEIPTRPPSNLQRQPLLALAVLASRPGEVVTMAELAEGMHKLGGLRKRPVAPEAKDLRYKILRPIKKALGAVGTELDELVETVQGVGMWVAGGASCLASAEVRKAG